MIIIIATIKPRHLSDIKKGNKIWLVRKSIPNRGFPFRVLCCESGSGGEIKAEFVCYRYMAFIGNIGRFSEKTLSECCLSFEEIEEYSSGKSLYLWRIDELKDYSETKCSIMNIRDFGIDRVPQSWCYVECESLYNV